MTESPWFLAAGRATVFFLGALAACGGTTEESSDAGPDAPLASPAAVPCPAHFERVASIDTGTSGYQPHSLQVLGGSLFFAVHGGNPMGGIWSVPVTGGTPTRISSLDADALWTADAQTLLAASMGALYTVPASGGATTRIGGLDPSVPQAGVYSADDTDVYLASEEHGWLDLWRLPRTGSPPTHIFTGTDAGPNIFAPFSIDQDDLYFFDSTDDASADRVMRLSKSGGSPMALPGVVSFEEFDEGVLAVTAGKVFVGDDKEPPQGYTHLEAIPLDGGARQQIDAVQAPFQAVVSGGSLFVASTSGAGVPVGEYSSGAVWEVEATTGAARLVACGPPHVDGGPPPARAVEVAVDATNVYAAFRTIIDTTHWELMRAPR